MVKKVKRRELPKGYVEPQKLRKEFKENRITGKNKIDFSSFLNLFQRLTYESIVAETNFI